MFDADKLYLFDIVLCLLGHLLFFLVAKDSIIYKKDIFYKYNL